MFPYGSADKFNPAVLVHLFRSAIVNKSSTEHHAASGLFPWQKKFCCQSGEPHFISASLRFLALIHRSYLCALLRCEGELAAIEGEESLCTEAVNAAVDRL